MIQGVLKSKTEKLCCVLSCVMTIIIAFHSSGYRTFKHYYTQYVVKHLLLDFPNLVSCNRFVELMRSALIPLCYYLQTRKGKIIPRPLLSGTTEEFTPIKSSHALPSVAKTPSIGSAASNFISSSMILVNCSPSG